MMHEISIYEEELGEERWFSEVEDFCSLNKMKKKILNKWNFLQSEHRHIYINFMELYPTQPSEVELPAKNDITYKTLLNFLLKNDRPIKIKVTFLEDKEKVKKKAQIYKMEGEMLFDQNGSVIEDEDGPKESNIEDINLPQYPPKYNSQEIVRCGFCHRSNYDKEALSKCGGFYGPFQNNKYSHLLCALWCHKVFINDKSNSELQKVEESMKEAENMVCNVCKKEGAGLVCFTTDGTKKKKKCSFQAHYFCAVENKCKMNWLNYKMLCPRCRPKLNRREEIEILYESDFEVGKGKDKLIFEAMKV